MIDRLMAFNARPQAVARSSLRRLPARCAKASWTKPSRSPTVTRRATWPRSSWPGLQEFQAHQLSSNEIPGEEIEASKRALERAEAIVHAELKRGISSLATIGSTAPFVGLFGTVVGIINAFRRHFD